MRATLKTIAEMEGCSVTTVSHVLNGLAKKYRISEEREQSILEAAKKVEYKPDSLAKGLRTKKSFTLGLVIPDISNPFFATIVRSVEREARKSNYSIILCDSEDSTRLEKRLLNMLQDRKVDGLIVFPVGIETSHLSEIWSKGMPLVLVDRGFPNLDIPFVSSDNYKGAFEAVSYLIKNGHTVIACIQGLPKTFPNESRIQGYIDAHKEHNLPINDSLIVGDSFSMQNGYIETKILLHLKNRPTAIFGLSNLISLGALNAIYDEGFTVPDDVSLISFDDQPYLPILASPMTTIIQQSEEMGKIAVKILLNQLSNKNKQANTQIYLPTKLAVRKSVSRRIRAHPNNSQLAV